MDDVTPTNRKNYSVSFLEESKPSQYVYVIDRELGGRSLGQGNAKRAAIVVLAIVYFGFGKLGLTFCQLCTLVQRLLGARRNPLLAALLFLGYEVWSGVWLGAFVVNPGPWVRWRCAPVSPLGTPWKGLAGAYLVLRLAGGRSTMGRAQDIFKFVFLAGIVSTIVARDDWRSTEVSR